MMHADDPVTHVFELEQEVARLKRANSDLIETLKDIRVEAQSTARWAAGISVAVGAALDGRYSE